MSRERRRRKPSHGCEAACGNSGSGLGTRGQTRESRVRPRTCPRADPVLATSVGSAVGLGRDRPPRGRRCQTCPAAPPPRECRRSGALRGEGGLLPTTICVMCCALASRMISDAGLSARRRRKTAPRERVSASASARTRCGLGVHPAVLRLDAEDVELRVAAAREACARADEIGVRVAAVADGDEDALYRSRTRGRGTRARRRPPRRPPAARARAARSGCRA